ncbi:MAG: hypothetical protein LBO72_01830 [Helicobacteraceae bacterium]|jgi:hypothetical protein|nr:hypothetical protein [Helicobacteraceae bacterium]
MAETATKTEAIKAPVDSQTNARRALAIKIALTVAAALLLCASYWNAAREKSFDALFAPIDNRAEEYLEGALTKAALTYASVRGAHAIVSMFKGTELHPPFFTVSVGEALSPALDMVERLSDALALAIASLGAQRILMEIGSQIGLSFFVSLGAIALALGVWIAKFRRVLVSLGARLVVLGLAARLIIPLMAIGASATSEAFLQSKYEKALTDMQSQQTAFDENVLPSAETGFMDKVKSWANMDALTSKIDSFKERAEALTKSLIALFSLFVFEALVFPIASFWLLSRLFLALIPRKD